MYWFGGGKGLLGTGVKVKFLVPGSGFRVPGSRFRVQGSGFKVPGSRFRVQGFSFLVQGFWFKVPNLLHEHRSYIIALQDLKGLVLFGFVWGFITWILVFEM
jgi:hypothetical protein